MEPIFSIDLTNKKAFPGIMAKLSPRMQMFVLAAMAPDAGDKAVTLISPTGDATITVPAKRKRKGRK